MKNKILALSLLLSLAVFGITGCSNKTLTVNVENDEQLNIENVGMESLIELGSGLYYDSGTRIVYWWNGYYETRSSTTPTPYYASNGLPYRYNPETNTFEEIK